MINRVTSSAINANLVRDMQNSYTNYAKLTEQLSSGKKITSILDDPIQALNIINSNKELNKIDIWTSNIDSLTNEINETSDTIDFLINKGQRVIDLTTSAANQVSGGNNLESTLTELGQVIDAMVNMANNKYNGNYIFSGTNTKTPTYTIQYGVDADGDKTDEIIGIKYNGSKNNSESERKLEISDGVFQAVNVTGIEAFGEYDVDGNKSGIMENMIELRNTLSDMIENNNTDYSNLNGLIDKFSNSLEKMVQVNTRFGTINNKLEMSKESLEGSQTNLKGYISNIQNIDMTEAVSDWYSSQYSYQASMQVFSAFSSMSLLNYM